MSARKHFVSCHSLSIRKAPAVGNVAAKCWAILSIRNTSKTLQKQIFHRFQEFMYRQPETRSWLKADHFAASAIQFNTNRGPSIFNNQSAHHKIQLS